MVGYNVQTAVAAKHRLIGAHELTNDGVDRNEVGGIDWHRQGVEAAGGFNELAALGIKGWPERAILRRYRDSQTLSSDAATPNKKGSSRITGKDALDLHEKELAISVTVRHSLDDLYSIVYPFQLTGVHRPANPAHDASPVNF